MHLMQQAGAPPEASTMVGDSAIDLRTARAAGIRACLVRYGFGFRTAEAELSGNELVAETANDLTTLLLTANP
jgi:phosphoglycolate phosphatase-like HAD superfamily hydrolase